MPLILCALGDPLLKRGDLLWRELLLSDLGRHDRTVAGDSFHDFARRGTPFYNRGMPVSQSRCILRPVQSQAGFAGSRIGTVAGEAVLRKDGADVLVVAELL